MRPSSVPLSSSTTHHEDTDADLGFFPLHTNEGSSPLLPPPTSWTTKKNSNEPSPFLPPSSIPKNKHPSLSTQASSTHPLNLASMETPPTRFTTTTLPPSNFRWVILSLTCTVLVGVAALNIPLETYLGLPNTTYQYLIGSFYIAYSLPNIVLPFLGGSFMDRYGAQWIAFVFSIFVVLGQYCFTFGIIGKSQGWAIFGRCLFGIGSETLAVAQQRITTKWFIGNELALAVGINLSVARLGSVINDVVRCALSPPLALSPPF
ncbi:hypothetical protein HMI55_007386 [Coelomomyces lativittatus]|nr:hypothetical protein HMI55_007386 [Coelomomyces lativittatus]